MGIEKALKPRFRRISSALGDFVMALGIEGVNLRGDGEKSAHCSALP